MGGCTQTAFDILNPAKGIELQLYTDYAGKQVLKNWNCKKGFS